MPYPKTVVRCPWSLSSDLMIKYHDEEWGVPVHDDRKLFEFIVLDTFQAGLSWNTILNRRENFRNTFDNFEPAKVARYSEKRIQNSFDKFIWQFTGYKTIKNRWKDVKQIPPRTAHSDAMSEALYEKGFKFVGSTIWYAFMQAAGMVNDHLIDCYRYRSLKPEA